MIELTTELYAYWIPCAGDGISMVTFVQLASDNNTLEVIAKFDAPHNLIRIFRDATICRITWINEEWNL